MQPLQPAYFYPAEFQQQDDEIDLLELLTAVFSQWRWLLGITLAGTVLGVLIALLLPRQYDAVAQVTRPVEANLMALNTTGYEEITPQQGFSRYYNQISSAERLKQFVYSEGWFERLFPDVSEGDSKEELFSEFLEGFETVILKPKEKKGEENQSEPELVRIKMSAPDEKLIVELVNSYIENTNEFIIDAIRNEGLTSVKLKTEEIEQKINVLRDNEKKKRELLIQKIENTNNEKIKSLTNEIDSLLAKASMDRESEIARITEAIKIAEKMGIKKPTTIEALATGDNTKTMVSLGGNTKEQYALMGVVYLNGELENLKNRQNEELFIPEIPKIKKQIEDIKHDEKLIALKERVSDDPYIEELPALLKRLDELKNMDFKFEGARLYRWDKRAIVDGVAEKPKRKLIVIIGFVLSAFVSLFVVLIMNAINKRKAAVVDSAE